VVYEGESSTEGGSLQVNSGREGKILYVTSTRINIPLAVIHARTRRVIFHFNLEQCDGSLSAPSMRTNNGKIYELRAEKEETAPVSARKFLRIIFAPFALSRPSTQG